MARDYEKEYQRYQGTPKQIKRRASRNKARAMLEKEGKVHRGDKRDVIHKSGNPMQDKRSNLGVQSQHKNRSYPRTKSAKKKNPRD